MRDEQHTADYHCKNNDREQAMPGAHAPPSVGNLCRFFEACRDAG
jgi:hypothetical protein